MRTLLFISELIFPLPGVLPTNTTPQIQITQLLYAHTAFENPPHEREQ